MHNQARNETQALADHLEQHINGFRGPLTLDKFTNGQSNPTYLLTADSGKYVLRRKPPGKLLNSAHAVDREYRVLHALAGSEVPVAKPLHLCEDLSVIGSMFYVMSYEQGRIFWNPALPELAKQDRRAILDEQIRVLAALHDVDIQAVGLSDYGKSGNYCARQIGRWSKQYRAAETNSISAMEELMQWLAARVPVDDGMVSLVHGDYRIDNLIYHPDEPRVSAVIDWELSTLGHPVADLAYLCMCMRLPDVLSVKGLGGADPVPLGLPTEAELVDRYCELRGIQSIDNWLFYLVFSFFRFASILQGVYKRTLDGNASDPKAKDRENMAPLLAEMALRLIEGAR